MKSTDLRIGNYIAFNEDDSISKVIGIHTNPCGVDVQIGDEETYIELRQFSVIELTEEILFKCGLVKTNGQYGDYFYHKSLSGFRLWRDDITNTWQAGRKCLVENKTYWISGNVKHLHQLQNLFFTLTGQELNVQI